MVKSNSAKGASPMRDLMTVCKPYKQVIRSIRQCASTKEALVESMLAKGALVMTATAKGASVKGASIKSNLVKTTTTKNNLAKGVEF